MKKTKKHMNWKEFLLWTNCLLFVISTSIPNYLLSQEETRNYRYLNTVKGDNFWEKEAGTTENSNIIGIEILDNNLYFLNKRDGLFTSGDLPLAKELRKVQVANNQKDDLLINSLKINSNNELVLFYENKYYYNLSSNATERFRHLDEDIAFTDFVLTENGTVVAGTKGKGLIIYKPETSYSIRHNQYNNDFISNNINTLFEDSKNNIWIGTDMGLAVYNSGEVKILTTPERSLFQKVFNPIEGKYVDMSIEAITERFGKLIIASKDGVFEVETDQDSIVDVRSLGIRQQLGEKKLNFVNDLMVDHRNDLWIAGNILLKYNFITNQIIKVFNDFEFYNSQRAICLAEDTRNKSVWVGTGGSGIFVIDNNPTISSQLLQEVNSDPPPSNIPVNKKFIAKDILFEMNSRNIKPESFEYLREIAAKLQKLSKSGCLIQVVLEGHTSKDRAANKNNSLDLSQWRAEEIRNYFIGRGIDHQFFKCIGMGDSEPNQDCDDSVFSECHRRVEMLILSDCED